VDAREHRPLPLSRSTPNADSSPARPALFVQGLADEQSRTRTVQPMNRATPLFALALAFSFGARGGHRIARSGTGR
jgi:hypothetical protein